MQVRPGRSQQLLREKAAEIEAHLAEIKRLQAWVRMQSVPCSSTRKSRMALPNGNDAKAARLS